MVHVPPHQIPLGRVGDKAAEGDRAHPAQEARSWEHGQAARIALRGLQETHRDCSAKTRRFCTEGVFWKVHGLLAAETKPGRKEKINTHCSKEQVQEPVTALGGTRARGMQAHVSGLLAHSTARGAEVSPEGARCSHVSVPRHQKRALRGPPRAPALDQATARSTASTAAPSTLREPGACPQFVLFIPAKSKHPERSFQQGEVSTREKGTGFSPGGKSV